MPSILPFSKKVKLLILDLLSELKITLLLSNSTLLKSQDCTLMVLPPCTFTVPFTVTFISVTVFPSKESDIIKSPLIIRLRNVFSSKVYSESVGLELELVLEFVFVLKLEPGLLFTLVSGFGFVVVLEEGACGAAKIAFSNAVTASALVIEVCGRNAPLGKPCIIFTLDTAPT